ncbi:MAG: recombinase family protein [Candidatus Methanomethylophilaceae archaeon]|jgi:DNA invertase Pin-like site-specific DNA recombinase|nr:recombinase family protein [Candidatus Methanomethylophilaceae archaeon]NLF33883.1 recombinase family protein [Thermoplasmatales archaeon]
MRAALYTRVSTEDQAREGYSLDAQTKRLEAYCRSRGWTVSGLYRDEGCSGRTTDRPEYQRMMHESEDWDVLLVLKMDRIHRNSVNFALMMDDLRRKGKEFNSMQERFDTTTAMGRFVMDIVQRVAQLESEQIGERVRIGMERKARFGSGPMGSGHPYGYVYNDGRLEVVEDEAYTVKAIFRLYRKGRSMEDIAGELNAALIPAKKGGKWNKQTICNILHNPIYVGYTRWDDVVRPGEHAAIVDTSDFEYINGSVSTTNTL